MHGGKPIKAPWSLYLVRLYKYSIPTAYFFSEFTVFLLVLRRGFIY